MQPRMKRLLLLGGGHAHVQVLAALAREPLPGFEVLLLTPWRRQMYSGMVPGLVAGRYRAGDCAIPHAPLAAAAGVRLIEGAAVGLDAAARCVRWSAADAPSEEIGYDILSVDTGPAMDRDALPGAREHALFVRPIEEFVLQLDALWARAATSELDIAVVGGGAAGFELVLALRQRLAAAARLSLVTGGPPPLAGYPAGVLARGRAALAQRGIAVVEQRCVGIEAGRLVLGDGARPRCDLPLLALGGGAPAWLAGSGRGCSVPRVFAP